MGKVLLLFFSIFFFNFGQVFAQEDLFLGQIKNPSRKHVPTWGLMLGGSFSNRDQAVDEAALLAQNVKSFAAEATVSKLVGLFEPFFSIRFANVKNTLSDEDSPSSEVTSFFTSSGLIFNILSQARHAVVPFVRLGATYSSVEAKSLSQSRADKVKGISWEVGGGVKLFFSKRRNFGVLFGMDYVDFISSTIESTDEENIPDTGDEAGFRGHMGVVFYL